MANWCSNYIDINGKFSDIEKFLYKYFLDKDNNFKYSCAEHDIMNFFEAKEYNCAPDEKIKISIYLSTRWQPDYNFFEKIILENKNLDIQIIYEECGCCIFGRMELSNDKLSLNHITYDSEIEYKIAEEDMSEEEIVDWITEMYSDFGKFEDCIRNLDSDLKNINIDIRAINKCKNNLYQIYNDEEK